MRTISIGKQGFLSMREENCFYIDKTDFIREWWEAKDDVTLITRPRRFGKTLNISMLECFFSNKYAGRHDLFEGLSIWNREEYKELQGTYPVIFLSFANVKGKNSRELRQGIVEAIAELYHQHSYLLKVETLSADEMANFFAFSEYINGTRNYAELSDTTIAHGIKKISMYLERHFQKKVLIFLDEYDTPMQEAYIHHCWEEMAEFTRSLFNATFKTNPYLERGIMTGITRISKESIFSDLNNLKVITTTSENYATAFGFTEKEVFASLEEAGMSREQNRVKEWYDGFRFGSENDIYNPWSITNLLDEKEYKPYWAATSSNALVSNLIRTSSISIKKQMEDLLKGNSIYTEIDEQIVFEHLEYKEQAVWSLLLAGGYLKVKDYTRHKRTLQKQYELVLTNFEVELMFDDLIREWFSKSEDSYNDFIKALIKGNTEEMNYYMNQVAMTTFSYFDTGKHPSSQIEPERFYHGFVLGLLVECRDSYDIQSNRESGLGRYDVLMKPLQKNLPAIIIEFKVHNPKKENSLADTVKAALQQIHAKAYDTELLSDGIHKEQIRHYGFAFAGKQVLIGGNYERENIILHQKNP